MEKKDPVSEYIKSHPKWSAQLKEIREILLKTSLNEEIKWGVPSYTLDKKLVLGIAAFKKSFCHLVSSRCVP